MSTYTGAVSFDVISVLPNRFIIHMALLGFSLPIDFIRKSEKTVLVLALIRQNKT